MRSLVRDGRRIASLAGHYLYRSMGVVMKSKYQLEYESLPEWVREIVDAIRPWRSYGERKEDVGDGSSAIVGFSDYKESGRFIESLQYAIDLNNAMTAPYPPPPAPKRERRSFNIVEMMDEDSAFDVPCCFGNHVHGHAVYCHNEAWPNSPRKCRRNMTDYPYDECPGFVANPDWMPQKD